MSGLLQGLQIVGAIISVKMTGDMNRHMRIVVFGLILLMLVGSWLQLQRHPL